MGENIKDKSFKYEPLPMRKDDLQIRESIKTLVPDHQVLITCDSSHHGHLMSEWLEVEGFDAFIKWYKDLPDIRREDW